MQGIVTLTPEESKRLIAKAVVQMEVVRKAKENGIIGLARCTSCAYIVEELTVRIGPRSVRDDANIGAAREEM